MDITASSFTDDACIYNQNSKNVDVFVTDGIWIARVKATNAGGSNL